MKTQASVIVTRTRTRTRTRSNSLALWAVLAALFALWACREASPSGPGDTNLRFDKIADSLAEEGYDRLEITVNRPGMDAPVRLYQGSVTPVASVPMPDSIGDSYQVTVKAFDDQKAGHVFQKVYTVIGGEVIVSGITVIPGGPDPAVPDTGTEGNPPLPATVIINPGSLELAAGGDTATLMAVIGPADSDQKVLWMSGNEEVAAVEASGLVRSKAVGAATIYARAAADTGKWAFIEVTVSEPVTVEKIELEPPTLRVFAGGPAAALQASVSPAGAPLLLNWESSDPAVAAVGADGKVTGLTAGTALVSAHYKGGASKSDTCRVTVVKDAPELDVGEDVSVNVGDTVVFTIKVTQEYGGIVEYRWSLDGDTAWEGIAAALPATLSRQYTIAGDVYAHFSVKDGEGNVVHAKRLIRVGGSAPVVAITSPADGFVTGQSVIDVAWTVDEVPQTIRLKDTLKVEGENIIKREITDGAGSKGSASVTVTLDTKAPIVAITSPAAGATVAANPVAVVWTVDSASQTAQTSETLSAGDGQKTITRSFTDKAGNTGTKSITVVMDLVKPKTPVLNAAGTTVSPTNAAGVTWKWTSGGAGGNGTFRYWLNSATVPTAPAPVTVAAAQAVLTGLAEGTSTLYVQEGDDQGNWSSIASQAIVIDRTLPAAIVFDGGAAQSVAAAACTVSVAAGDAGAGLASVAVAGASAGNGNMTTSGTGTAARYTKAVTLKSGLNTLTVTATDKAGNIRTGSAAVTYNQPVVTITSPAAGFVTSNPSVTISYTVSGSTGPKTYTPPAMTVIGDNTITTQEPGAANATIHIHYQPKVVFVRQGAPAGGDGTSWDKAYADLRVALESPRGSASGNKLWISEGTYVDSDLTVEGAFAAAAGVSLYGGFPATGRPSTEAGRNQSASGPKTVLTNNPAVEFAGLLTMSGPATLDGLSFSQTQIGPGSVRLGDGSAAARKAFTVKACEFKSIGGRVGSIFSAQKANVTMDSCTFEGANTLGSLIYAADASVKITRSRLQSNQCASIATVDGTLEFTSSTITLNTSPYPDGPAPDIIIQSGNIFRHAGVVTDVPSLLLLPVTP